MKRLIVYFHYDPLGQLDTACRVAVEAMAHYGEVFFISNSTLRPADRAWAASVTLTCRERENKGLDVGAYKEALAVIGRGRLARYDELVLMNFTLAGPVCSLASMFACNASRARPASRSACDRAAFSITSVLLSLASIAISAASPTRAM